VKRPTLGIVTNNRHHVFQRNIIAGVEEVAGQRGCDVVVDSIAENPRHPRPVSLDIPALAGVLVISNVLSDDFLRDLYHTGKPLSLISHRVPDAPIPAVIPDNREGIAKLVQYVVEECGRTRIVFIRGDTRQNDAVQRERTFRQEALRYTLQVNEAFMLDGEFIPEVAAASMSRLLQSRADFDAVLASDYLMGVAAVEVLRSAGRRVPEDVSVVGFGDGQEAEAAGLTTVAAHEVELGRRGARQLIGQIEGLRIQGVTMLSTELVERATGKGN